MAFLATFLIALGFLQLISVYFQLRGLSLTGPLTGPGILVGILILMAGVWLAVDMPLSELLLYGLLALVPAIVVLLLGGTVANLGWDPMQHFLHDRLNTEYRVEEVSIPVELTHVRQGETSGHAEIPASFITPQLWSRDIHERTDGKAILLVCGAGDTRHTFKWRILQELLHEHIAVLTVDPPGHGDFQYAPMTLANAKAALRAALDWLAAQPDVHHIGACGISFGGNQVAWLASQDERICCAALISTPVSLNQFTKCVFARETLALFLKPRNIGVLRDGSFMTLLQEYRRLKGVQLGEGLYQMIDAFDTRKAIRIIGERPVMIVHGSGDTAVSLQNAYELYKAALPTKDLMLISQATHVTPVLYPREMGELARWFSRWLNYNRNDAQQAVQ